MKADTRICYIEKRVAYWIALLAIVWSIPGNAQVIGLDSVFASINQNNPSLKEYDSKMRAYQEYAIGASGWMAPMFGAGPFMRPYKSNDAMPAGNEGAWMFSIEQGIPNPAKQRARRNYIQSQGNVEGENRAIKLNTLKAEARLLYYEWLVAEQRIRLLKENAKLIEFLLRLGRIRYPYNQESLGSIYQAEARLAETENELLTTQGEIEQKSHRLKALMNLSPTDSIAVDTTTLVILDRIRIAEDTVHLSKKRSDARRIDQMIETLRLNQRMTSFQAKPDFSLRLDHMQAIGNMPNQFSAMAMITIPIAPWSSKSYKANIKGTQYEIEALQQTRESILVETRGQLSGIASRIDRLEKQLQNYRTRILPALRKGYQSLVIAYEENREHLPAVIEGWDAVNIAEADYLDKLSEFYTLIATYEKEIEK